MRRRTTMGKSDEIRGGDIDKNGKVVQLPSPEEIHAQAAEWIAVLGRDEVSAAEKARLKRWLAAGERHRAAFEELSALWSDLGALKELDDIAEAPAAAPAPSWINRRNVAAMAASLAAIVAAGGVYYRHLEVRALNQRGNFRTAKGEQRTIALSDGSSLQLNTGSHAEVLFSRAERVVRLTEGEAHFEVAEDKRRPFRVYAPGGLVEAVGTAFTVRVRDGDAVEVTVEEGRVALASLSIFKESAASAGAEPVERAQLAQLTAGQRAVFAERVEEIEQLPEPELRRKLSWRQGMLAYSGESLAEVVDDISRYTDISIEIADPSIRDRLVAGYFRVGETEALFESLERSFGIEVQRIDANHVKLVSAS